MSRVETGTNNVRTVFVPDPRMDTRRWVLGSNRSYRIREAASQDAHGCRDTVTWCPSVRAGTHDLMNERLFVGAELDATEPFLVAFEILLQREQQSLRVAG